MEAVTATQWKMMRCPVASVTGPDLTMQDPCWHNANVFQGQASRWSFRLLSWLENAREFLDQPGEWYLDEAAGWLYYIPRPGEELATAAVELPVLEVLLEGAGTPGRPVEHLRFEGLTFTHATWLGPSGPEGYAADQGGFHLAGGEHPPNSIGHDENVTRTPGNVRFRYAREIEFRGNAFERLGSVALDFDTGSQLNVIVDNRFEDLSSGAIQMGGVTKADHHPDSRAGVTRDNLIAGNLLAGRAGDVAAGRRADRLERRLGEEAGGGGKHLLHRRRQPLRHPVRERLLGQPAGGHRLRPLRPAGGRAAGADSPASLPCLPGRPLPARPSAEETSQVDEGPVEGLGSGAAPACLSRPLSSTWARGPRGRQSNPDEDRQDRIPPRPPDVDDRFDHPRPGGPGQAGPGAHRRAGPLLLHSRVYFTADIDLAYVDRDALDAALRELDFVRKGRYSVHEGLDLAVEAPASELTGEDAPRESVEIEGGLRCMRCVVIGLEDLILDRMNACRHRKSEVDCEMAELLVVRYREELDWVYLEKRAALQENDTLEELRRLKERKAP